MKKLMLFFSILFTVGLCYSQSVETNIVLINAGNYDKRRIAKEISIINGFNPKVISLDIAFPEYVGDSDDKQLILALQSCKKLVMPSEIYSEGVDYYGKEMISVVLTCSKAFFPWWQAKAGFVTAIGEKGEPHIPRQFIVSQEGYSGDTYYHFSIVTAQAFDSLKTVNFIQSHDRLVDVDYRNGNRKFKTFSPTEVLSKKITKKDIEGKIVLMGFLGPGNQDKFFTPLNKDSNEPDMYGVEYLANIVAQILESK